MALASSLLAAFSLSLALLAWIVQGRSLRRAPRRPRSGGPGGAAVSILKPLKGADPGLEENLRSFFLQDHLAYELLFGIQEPWDPAGDVVRRLIAEHPAVPARLVLSNRGQSLNPKVDNLAGLEPLARHELLLISDSNVRVAPGYLSDLVAHIEDPGVGLVSSPIRAHESSGIGGALESLQLNVFVMGGALTVTEVFGQPCVVGKSMMLRRADLHRLGGLAHLGQYLAEDQVCGEEVAALGLRVVMTGQPVDNVLGRLGIRQFAGRHLRWARLRWRLAPAGYLAEPLLNPVPMALLAGAAGAGAAPPLLALAAMTLLSGAAEHRLGLRPNWAALPIREAARSLAVAALWPFALTSSRVSWRGNSLRVGKRTKLLPVEVPVPVPVLEQAGGSLRSPEWRRA